MTSFPGARPRAIPRRPAPSARPPLPGGPRALSPPHLASLALLAVSAGAAGLRLADLGRGPLHLSEGAYAFSAWLAARGLAPLDGPLGLTGDLMAVLFRAGADGDGAARLVPALAGTAAVPALYLLGRELGRGPALLAAALLALSPLAVASARSALPGSLGALLSLLLLVSFFAWLRGRRRALLPLALLTGLALGADAVAVTTLLALGAFLALEGCWRGAPELRRALAGLVASPGTTTLAVLAFLLALALTMVGSWLGGPSLALPGLHLLASLLSAEGPGTAPRWLFLGYDWPLCAAGLGGALALLAAWAGKGGGALRPLQRFLLVWALTGLLVLALSGRAESGDAPALLLPLALLGGWVLWRLLEALAAGGGAAWALAGLVAVYLVFGGVALSRWAAGASAALGPWAVAAGALGLLALTWTARERTGGSALAGLGLAGAAGGLLFALHSAWAVAFGAESEFALGPRPTPALQGLARELSSRPGDGAPVALAREVAPALGWHLRGLPLALGDPPQRSTVYIDRAGVPPPRGFQPRGAPMTIAEDWHPPAWTLRGLWRWLVHRQPYGPPNRVEVQLFQRSP